MKIKIRKSKPKVIPVFPDDEFYDGFCVKISKRTKSDWRKAWAAARLGDGDVNEMALGQELQALAVRDGGWEGLTLGMLKRLLDDPETLDVEGEGDDSSPVKYSPDLLEALLDGSTKFDKAFAKIARAEAGLDEDEDADDAEDMEKRKND